MALLSLLDVSLAFGGPSILEKANLQIDPGERVCLVGRNGAGKSTLMKIITGQMQPDKGDIFRSIRIRRGPSPAFGGIRIDFVSQNREVEYG